MGCVLCGLCGTGAQFCSAQEHSSDAVSVAVSPSPLECHPHIPTCDFLFLLPADLCFLALCAITSPISLCPSRRPTRCSPVSSLGNSALLCPHGGLMFSYASMTKEDSKL